MSAAPLCNADFYYLGSPDYQNLSTVRMSVKNGREFDNPGWEPAVSSSERFPQQSQTGATRRRSRRFIMLRPQPWPER